MDQSSSSDESLDSDAFGPLLSISEPAIIELAAKIRSRIFDGRISNAQLLHRVAGSYNIVHIIQLDELKFVIRVPSFRWGDGLTENSARALESQIAT